MARYGMLLDTNKCVGCYACRVACQMQNELTINEAYIKFYEHEEGTYPNVTHEMVPVQCQHCTDAPCVSVCPTGASHTREDGIVVVDESKCIGCKYCAEACPYHARIVIEETGTIEKCIFCHTLVEQGEQPACVTTCITNARVFGDLDDPNSELNQKIIEKRAMPIAGDLTKSNFYYVR
ncbi:MAG: 4Fe-4S dicluster domain-containing protein [Coriobacteriia bacterium]|nr:4Fe-4S dicluster domain-containing protein [Coriobacteriia bacterium]